MVTVEWTDAGIVAAIVAILQLAKLIPSFKQYETYFPFAALVLGIVGVSLKSGDFQWTYLLSGLVTGLTATIAHQKLVKPVEEKIVEMRENP